MARPRVRERVLRAAAALWRERGPSALTTRAVAEAAGVTEASLYNNVGDKQGLLQALRDEALPEHGHLQQLLTATTEPLPRWLEQVFLTAADYFRAVMPLAAQSLSGPGVDVPGATSPHVQLTARLAGLPRPPADPEALALLLLGAAMHTATTSLALGRSALGVPEVEVARRVVAGLGLAAETNRHN